MEKFDSFFLKIKEVYFGMFVLINYVIVLWNKLFVWFFIFWILVINIVIDNNFK